MNQKIVLFGKNGQVGLEIRNFFVGYSHFLSFSSEEVDFLNPDQILKCLDYYKPNVVINAVAFNWVDLAEEDSRVFQINTQAVEYLARWCQIHQATLIHFSSDYIFDGLKNHPYVEKDAANPLGNYGFSKWKGEEIIRFNLERYYILRTSWVFGLYRKNFLKTILKLASHKNEIHVVHDQLGSPTWSFHLAQIVVQIVNSTNPYEYGTYHVTNHGICSWYDYATLIVEEGLNLNLIQNKNIKITPISSTQYPTKAKRPAYSKLDTSKLEKIFSIKLPSWESCVKQVLLNLKYSFINEF